MSSWPLSNEIPDNICYDWDLGDSEATEAAFKMADHVARVKLVNNRLIGNPMEPRGRPLRLDAAILSRMRSEVTSRSNWANDSRTFNLTRTYEFQC